MLRLFLLLGALCVFDSAYGESQAQKPTEASAAAAPLVANPAVVGLANSIFAKLLQETGGDPEKLTQAIEKLKSNPQSLVQQMTPEQKAEFQKLAQELKKAQASSGEELPAFPKK